MRLTDSDLSILQCSAKAADDQLKALRAAAEIVDGSAVPIGPVYGLIRQGFPATLAALAAPSPAR